MFKHKKQLIISSVLILLPIVFGLLLWNQLPDVMATHWGVNEQPDGWSSKTFAVFGMPLLLLGMHWLCLWISEKDPGHRNQSKKAIAMIFWIMPMISIFCSAIMYRVALGNSVNISSILFMMMGLMFVGIGNYMPKIKQNYHLGIKVIWALRNEENWNATHRFAGKVWFFGGWILILAALFPMQYSFALPLPIMLILAFLPMLYSYLYYRKQCREGRGYSLNKSETEKLISRISTTAVVVILILVTFVMFTGDIHCVFSDSSFTIEASFYDDLTVDYDTIDSIELRRESVPGTRSYGFGSARLLLGVFDNEEFGMHTRYTYTGCECAVIITSGEKTLVLAGSNAKETESIYETLLSKTGLGG